MSTPSKPENSPSYVTIVSNNPETLDGLQQYLRNAGVPSHSTRAVHKVAVVAPDCATATVIFPDEFEETAVVSLLNELRRKHPRLLTLLVTRAPNRFRSILHTDEWSNAPIVLPKPSFGWDILDAIRGHSPNQ
jgi:hypothetical protein